jgi:hypothetical protein
MEVPPIFCLVGGCAQATSALAMLADDRLVGVLNGPNRVSAFLDGQLHPSRYYKYTRFPLKILERMRASSEMFLIIKLALTRTLGEAALTVEKTPQKRENAEEVVAPWAAFSPIPSAATEPTLSLFRQESGLRPYLNKILGGASTKV